MSINLKNMVILLKATDIKVFIDKAPLNTPFSYIVYTNISVGKKVASSKTLKLMPLYQISLFTTGTEKALLPLEKALQKVPHTYFSGIQGDENDDTVTNYYTQIRLVEEIGKS